MHELVSVIIPTYNRAHCIKNAINSVLAQEYDNLEIIIVDDGSSDDTRDIVSAMGESCIKYIYNSENYGVSRARNIGMQVAQGEYIAFQDSDDIWFKDKLKKQINLMKERKYGMVFSGFERSFLDGHTEIVPRVGIQQEAKHGMIYPYLLAESYIGMPTVVVRRTIMEHVQGFDENMKSYEDYDFALQVAKCCKVGFVDEILVQASTLEDSIDMNMTRGIISSAYLLKKYDTDLKQYGLYERKKKIVLENAKVYGIWEPIENFLKK